MELKDDKGDPFLATVHLFAICEECRKLPTKQEMTNCTHGNNLPPWKSYSKHKRNKTLSLALDSDGARGLRENAGVIGSDYQTVFDRAEVHKIFDKPRLVNTLHSPPRLYMAVDPDAGGKSFMSIISGYVLRESNNRTCHSVVVCFFFIFFIARCKKRKRNPRRNVLPKRQCF